MPSVISTLETLPPLVVLAVAFALIVGETATLVGLTFPSEHTLMFVGFMAYLGVFPLWLGVLVMIMAGLVGDSLAYRAGRKYGPRIRAGRVGGWVGERRWERAERMLDRLGGWGVAAARWLPFVRTLLPRLAGSVGMPYRRFAAWNGAGVVTAVGESVILGYLVGASYAQVATLVGQVGAAVLLALVVGAVGTVLARRWWNGRCRPRVGEAAGGLASE